MIHDRIEQFVTKSAERSMRGPVAAHREDGEEHREFDELALAVFAHQYEHVPLYRRLCELRGIQPGDVSLWRDIPAAPADLFKEQELVADGSPAVRTFASSGTTQGPERPSRHILGERDLALYRRSSLAHFAAMAMPDSPGPMTVILLGPGAATHPSSSLGHMYQFVIEEFGCRETSSTALFDAAGTLDAGGAIESLERAAAGTRPVLLLSLRSTITAVIEALRDRRLALRLPADSRLVHTGGNKGGRTMSRAGILKAAWRFLHIPSYHCIEEYGMTELLSQFYDVALRSRWSGRNDARSLVGPAWTRTLVVDPATLSPVGPGERGILRHFDLANCGSVSAVQTLDLGVQAGRGFDVLGRASGAEARGCSQLLSGLSGSISGEKESGLS